jgi:hypothetical protein
MRRRRRHGGIIDDHATIPASRLGTRAFTVIVAGTCVAGIGTTKADIRVGQAGHARVLAIMTRDPGVHPWRGHARTRSSSSTVGGGSNGTQDQAPGPNFVDVDLSRGEHSSSLPFTLGYDGAGIIDAVGEGVKEFKPGDRVAYTGHLGTYTEASVVPASKLIPLARRSFVRTGRGVSAARDDRPLPHP